MKFALTQLIAAAVVGAQCAMSVDVPAGDMQAPVHLRVSARQLLSKDRILGIKTSEADPFYRLWSCADYKCHNKHLIAQSERYVDEPNPRFLQQTVEMPVISRDPYAPAFLLELIDWNERSVEDPRGTLIGKAMLTPAELMQGVMDRRLTAGGGSEYAANRKVPGYVSIDPLRLQLSPAAPIRRDSLRRSRRSMKHRILNE